MQRYFDVVQNRQGTAVVGATVTVFDANGNLATLYSSPNSAPTSNPVYTNMDGEYAFYAANASCDVSADGTSPSASCPMRRSAALIWSPAVAVAMSDSGFYASARAPAAGQFVDYNSRLKVGLGFVGIVPLPPALLIILSFEFHCGDFRPVDRMTKIDDGHE